MDFELMIPLKGPSGGPIEKIILGDSRKIAFLHSLGHEQPSEKMAVAAGSPQKAAVAALGVGG
jgi:hypothetical protein